MIWLGSASYPDQSGLTRGAHSNHFSVPRRVVQEGPGMMQLRFARFVLTSIVALGAVHAAAQAAPTATRTLQLSGFAGLTGVQTGLGGGRNLAISAGGDIGFRSVYSLRPSFEVRGTFPIVRGQIDSQRSVLAGLKLGKALGRIFPYGDVLFGRGEITYSQPTPNPGFTFGYLRNASNVLSLGGGIDVTVTGPIDFKVDAQAQRYSTPVTESSHLLSKQLTIGFVYRMTGQVR